MPELPDDLAETLARVIGVHIPEGGVTKPEVDYLCLECEDLHWVRIEILDKDREKDGPNHYMRPCSQCIPERYQIMVAEGHGEPQHYDRGGCSICHKYVKPWLKDEKSRKST